MEMIGTIPLNPINRYVIYFQFQTKTKSVKYSKTFTRNFRTLERIESRMDTEKQELKEILSRGETLRVEFKSDLKCLPDRELVAAVVALANTEGGALLLGVEDDGTVTGLHVNHLNTSGLSALIANKTNPSLAVQIEVLKLGECNVARIRIPKSRQLVSTSEGLLQRRRLMAKWQSPFLPA